MKRVLSEFVMPAIRFCRHRPAWVLAPLAAAAAAPAAAQTPCPATGWQRHDMGYTFSYYSGRRAEAPGLVHCVRNTGRGVFIDWRGAGLTSLIPPGKLIYSTSPAARFTRKTQLFFYGARRRVMTVPTASRIALLEPLGESWAGRSGAGPFSRAFAWKPAAAPVESGDNAAFLYVPTNLSLIDQIARKPLSLRKLIERLEAAPDELGAFEMRFANRVTAGPDGRLAVAWSCRYKMPKLGRTGSPAFYLRFSDPDLHRRMFNQAGPKPVLGWKDETEFTAALPPLEADRLAARRAKLQILFADRRTVIASIPISYSGPRG